MRTSFFCLVTLLALFPSSAIAAPPDAACDHGRLFDVDGATVLRVWGTPRERGMAHGELLGTEIVALMNAFLRGPVARLYTERVLPLLPIAFVFPRHIREELEGILEGLEKAVPEADRQIASLGRAVTLQDLVAFNSLGDWKPFACSTFSAWGEATRRGTTLVGRNFDYFLPEKALTSQILLAEEAGPGRKAFFTVSFPGSIGAITFLNDEGVFGAVHDVGVKPAQLTGGYTPRLITLRLIAEQATADDAPDKALSLCRKHRTAYGNNFHIALPRPVSGVPTACVIEYDALRDDHGGAQRREPSDPSCALWNTNHYRLRRDPVDCRRYEALSGAFRDFCAHSEKPLSLTDIKERIIKASAVKITMHQVVADLAARTFHVAFQRRLMLSAASETFHVVRWADVFDAVESIEPDDEESEF